MAWLSGWDNRIEFTIDSSKVDSDLTGFPVLIKLSNASGISSTDVTDVFTEVGGNSKKIAVTESDGTTEQYVEIERWDQANNSAWIWTNVASVSSSANTVGYVYYDNSQSDNDTYIGVSGSNVASKVWDSGFVGVWHMALDAESDTVVDSTQNNDASTVNFGSGSGLTGATDNLIDGTIDGAIEMDGVDDYVNIPNSTSMSFTDGSNDEPITFEAIVNMPDATTYRMLSKMGNSSTLLRDYYWSTSSQDKLFISLQDASASARIQSSTNTTFTSDENTWVYLSTTYDPTPGNYTGITHYRNGQSLVGNNEDGGTYVSMEDNGSDINIGAYREGQETAGGYDEFRASNVERPSEWIKATYHSSFDSLVAFGDPVQADSSSSSIDSSSFSSSSSIDSSSSTSSYSSESDANTSSSSSSSSSSYLDYEDDKLIPFTFEAEENNYAWIMAKDEEYVYVGTGPDGIILRSRGKAFWEEAYVVDDSHVKALYIENGLMYVGTAPQGKIYIVDLSTGVMTLSQDMGGEVVSIFSYQNEIYGAVNSPARIVKYDAINEKWDEFYRPYAKINSVKVFGLSMYLGLEAKDIIVYNGISWEIIPLNQDNIASYRRVGLEPYIDESNEFIARDQIDGTIGEDELIVYSVFPQNRSTGIQSFGNQDKVLMVGSSNRGRVWFLSLISNVGIL